MSAHTAGPWKVQRGDSVVHIITELQSLRVASTSTKTYYQRADDTDIANAHLIAAAPEMYAAIEAALSYDQGTSWEQKCRDALAKARGDVESKHVAQTESSSDVGTKT